MTNVIMWVAIYGAIISSVALVWNIISYITDKPKIVPTYSIAIISMLEGESQYVFSISFSNPTKHRVVVSSAGILFKNNQSLSFILGKQILPDDFPKVLLPGDGHSVHRDIDNIKKAIDEQGEPAYIWARDATGKTYKGSVKNMIKRVEAMYNVKHKDEKPKLK